MNRVGNNNTSKNNMSKNTNVKIIQSNSRPIIISNSGSSYSGSNVFGIILLVIIIIGFIAAAYWAYNFYTNKTFNNNTGTEVMSDVRDASSSLAIASGTIPTSSYSNEYSVSFWVNIADYNYKYGTEKVIMRRGTAGSGNPEIVLGAKSNDLIVRLKLQSGSQTVSKFTDIPIKLKPFEHFSKNKQPEEIASNDINFGLDNNKNFFKIGDNNVDYPMIQYTTETNTCSKTYNPGDYFNMISGNNINTIGENVEHFTDVDDAVNATVAVVVDLCDILKTLKSQQLADDSVDYMNTFFQSLIDALESARTTSKTTNDINTSFTELTSKISLPTTQSSSIMEQQFNKLETDMQKLATFNNVQFDYTTGMKAVNAKMSIINCPLTFDSATEVDGAISFFENIINGLKKSLYTYINNMGTGIKKTYPDLATNNISCLVDSRGANSDPTVGTCVVKMIPLQKWVCVIVSVYNQVVDIYIDGQLSSSCVLKSFPVINTDAVNITPDGGFSGKIARVNFMNYAMSVQQSKNIYYQGPNVSTGILSNIPNWVYWTIFIIIVIAILYSVLG